jgi:predicted ATPase
LPVLELLRGYFGIQDLDDAAARRAKVRAALSVLDPSLEETLPYLFGLLGIVEGSDLLAQIDPQIKRQRMLDAIKRIILREGLKQPVVVVIFEDLHWIDAQTQALLDVLADGLAGTSVLLLVNYRPEYRHDWTNKSYYAQLRLDPLGGAEGAAMLAALLGEGVELNPLKRLITGRTGGNPFFIEEIVQALFDEGTLTRNGAVKVTRTLAQLRLPPTVQGMLAARIDRLAAEHKELLQTLAVIGRESSRRLLRRVASPADSQLERMLAELQAGEFIYEQPATPEVEYVFKHALTQEVAYNSLLIERRKQLHEQAGQALESMFADQLDDHLSQLAHHYSHSDNAEKAVEYLGRAGQQSIQRSANVDAIGSLTAAIDLIHKLPEGPERDQRELLLELAHALALAPLKGFAAPEAEQALTRARELCERLGDPPELFPVLLGLWGVYFIRADFTPAYKLAEQLMRRAQSRNDATLLLLAHFALGDTSFNMGKLSSAREHLETVISLYDPARHGPFAIRHSVDVKTNVLSYVAMTLWVLGYPDQALKRANEAVEFSHALAHPHSLAASECFLGIVQQWRRETRAAQETAERLVALSTEHGLSLWLALGTIQRGLAFAENGFSAEGIARMEEGLAALRATGTEIGRPYWLSLLAEACIESSLLDHGLSALAEALADANETEGRQHEAEIYRLNGDLLLAQGNSKVGEAQSSFQRAIEIARSQRAKSYELRGTMSLARLLAEQGRRDEARVMLAEIYNWFTEGFDTADLKDAKALLDELSN